MEVNLGRVVGSKIRNGTKEPSDFTKEDFVGWLDGDIYILNNPEQLIPYYEYKPETEEKLILLGNLKGIAGVDGVDGEKGDTGPQGPQGMPGGFAYIGNILEDPFVTSGSPLDVYTTPGNYVFNMSYGSVICLMIVFEYYDKINQKIIKLSNDTIETITRQQQTNGSWDVSNSLPLKPYVNHNVSINLERKEEQSTSIESVDCHFTFPFAVSSIKTNVPAATLARLCGLIPYGTIPATGILYIYNVDHYARCLVTGLEKVDEVNTDKLYIKYIDITDEAFDIGTMKSLLIDVDIFDVTITSNTI